MKKYKCKICGWEYSEDDGLEEQYIDEGTAFEDLDDSFFCPICGAKREAFEEVP